MNGKFFLAAIPQPWTILGLRLKPFSAGHIVLLHRADSAFVAEGEYDEAQLATALYICAQDFEDGLASFDDPKTAKFMRDWKKKVGAFDLSEKLRMFAAYLKEGSTIPTYASKSESAAGVRNLDMPTVQLVKCTLLKAFGGMTEIEFLNRPWGLSLWDFVTLKGIEGAVDIYEDDVIANAQAVADALAVKFAGKAVA